MKFKKILYSILTICSLLSLNIKVNKQNTKNEIRSLDKMSDSYVEKLYNRYIDVSTSFFINDYYDVYYFNNLKSNFGNNLYGSCSFVALGMLLSFYDTYWDDSYVPEAYEVKTTYSGNLSFYIESPGIEYESDDLFGDLSYSEYLSAIETYKTSYFQLKLLSLAKTYFGSYKFDSSSNFGLTSTELNNFISYYLYSYLGKSTTDVSIESSSSSEYSIRNFAANKINSGIPVIIRAYSSTNNSSHAFIGFDYDEDEEDFYVHTGWRTSSDGSALTHVSLSDLGYDKILSATSLNVKSTYANPKNFVSSSGVLTSSSAYAFPQDLIQTNGCYYDILPIYKWNSLYKEKWYSTYNPYFEFIVYDRTMNKIFSTTINNTKTYRLTEAQWLSIHKNLMNSEKYYIRVNLKSTSYSFSSNSLISFSTPNDYYTLSIIKPSDYGFTSEYYTDTSIRKHFIDQESYKGKKFQTRMFRCGYFDNQYLVLSSVGDGINNAFIEYNLNTAVTRFDVGLSLYSSSELINKDNSTAKIEYFYNNEWVEVLDIYSLEDLSYKDNMRMYKVLLDNPVYRFRIIVNVNDTLSNEDLGRICIGNIALYDSNYTLPLSGSELDYNPSVWNGKYILYANCYSYALNAQKNPNNDNVGMQPGQSYTSNGISTLTETNLINAITRDADYYGFEFKKINKNERCDEGTYKIALVLSSGDYHFYRQNSDGTWSHKRGITKVINYDNSNEIIYDPETCDRLYGDDLNYTNFIGFYQVTPLNSMY